MAAATGPRIAFATYADLPDGSPDDSVAVEALRARGAAAVARIWRAPEVEWDRFDTVVLRSTWDYHLHVPEFDRWLETVARSSLLLNPLEIVRWNRHKGYLLELARRGVPVVPTELVRRDHPEPLSRILERRGWTEVAVKPAVGASTYRFLRVGEANRTEGERHLGALLADGDALVQPFLRGAADRGERSFVYFDGAFSHAVRYDSLLAEPVRTPTLVPPERSDLDTCGAILATLPEIPAYARLDFLPGEDGAWRLGELELIEPELFLRSAPGAPERLARAILRRSAA